MGQVIIYHLALLNSWRFVNRKIQNISFIIHQSACGVLQVFDCFVLQVKDIFYLHVLCKDARSVRLVFLSNDVCLDWFRRLLRAVGPPKSVDDIFAFPFYAWSKEDGGEKVIQRLKRQPVQSYFRKEVSLVIEPFVFLLYIRLLSANYFVTSSARWTDCSLTYMVHGVYLKQMKMASFVHHIHGNSSYHRAFLIKS